MDNLFEKLAEQIHLPEEIKVSAPFTNVEIEKVEIHTESRLWHFFLSFDELLPTSDFKLLSDLLKTAFADIAEVKLTLQARSANFDETLLNSYYQLIFDYPECSSQSFTSIFKNYRLIQQNKDGAVKLLVADLPQIERLTEAHLPIINALFQDFGFKNLQVTAQLDPAHTEKLLANHEAQLANQQEEAVKQVLQQHAYQKPAPIKAGSPHSDKITIGREIRPSEPITPMKDVINPEMTVVFEGYVFQAEHKEFTNRTTKKVSHMLEFGLTDYSSSFIIQKWARKNEFEVFDKIKKGLWVRAKGSVQMDNFKHELVMQLESLVEVAAKGIRKDSAPEDGKRVEFHTHTIMSTMDATVSATALVEQAAKWGHKAIAITDHAGLQSYPEAHNAGKKNGVKIIYGVEANLVADQVPISYNTASADLFESTYVVFDVETTGLSAVYNDLIQIAAVKMFKNNVIEEFDEFLNPGYPLSEFTTQLTGITDDHVKNARPIKEVLTDFQKFCEGTVLVAHNATFDVGFMNTNYDRQGLAQISQPVIDTLELARDLYPELKRHGLGPLTKKFQVALDHHHMANFDAEATGRLLFIFLEKIRDEYDFTDLTELNCQLIPADSYKKARVHHATIYAKDQIGLKNLFKLVSFSNIKYFDGVPRVPRSVLTELREGLLVGTACSEGELFETLTNKSFEDALEVANFYDFIEVMAPTYYQPLVMTGMLSDEKLQEVLNNLIKIGQQLKKPVIAVGDVHYLNPTDKIYREIIVRSQGPGAPINRPVGRGEHAMPAPLPDAHFMTTDEMLAAFKFLGDDLAQEIVVTNTQTLAEQFSFITPVRDDLYTPYMEGVEEEVARLTYEEAHRIYGDPLPDLVDARIEKELRSIIGNGFAVIYLIAQKLVHRSNARGYLVGSRGSVGSSIVATMIGITEVNPLPPHYICPNPDCKHSEFFTDGSYGSGFDMADAVCPDCGENMIKNGQDIPFETFLGFKGDKVPDIDLNFSGDDQPYAHLDVRDIFGADYAFRAGTIGTVADKTAYGYVKGYERDYGQYYRNAEIDRLAAGSAGVKRTTGQHAGGIIVIPAYMDVYDFSPIQFPADKLDATWMTTHFDFHAIHDNILKLDILGHDDPTMIRKLQNLSGLDPKDIPMDDKEVMKLFTGTESLGITPEQAMASLGTFGVPEMGTATSMRMIAEAKPKTFADLLQISGLSHGTDVWAGNAQDLIRAGIADLSHVIGCRDDIMTYLIHAGLAESMAFKIMERVRKGMWLKLDDAEREEYVEAMHAHKVPDWYIESCSKIKYMFPKAHAAAYIMMALRVAWFKVHKPMYYYAAWFSIRADAFDLGLMSGPLTTVKSRIKELRVSDTGRDDRTPDGKLRLTLELCNEMRERGLNFGKLDLYRSEAEDFIIDGDTLIPPFKVMPGLGSNVAQRVVEARKDGEFLSKNELKQRTGLSQTLVETLTEMGILDNMPEDNQLDLFDMF